MSCAVWSGTAVGDIVKLGGHRLMCGDAGNPKHVAALFAGRSPDLVFTSPPYLQQRAYNNPIACWDTLMQRVFTALPAHAHTQVLVNLGLVHRKCEWVPYWDGWIEWMRAEGWRRFGWYVWDKGFALPRTSAGRLGTAHEFIFHFNKHSRDPNKTTPCKRPGHKACKTGLRSPQGRQREYTHAGRPVGTHRVSDDVLRIMREMQRGHTGNHPAVFPIALPLALHACYTNPGELIYDPFAGAGTSILAAERGGRVCYAMEIEPTYCDIAVQRFQRATARAVPPRKPAKRAQRPIPFCRQLPLFCEGY